jgi:hypothetical protein
VVPAPSQGICAGDYAGTYDGGLAIDDDRLAWIAGGDTNSSGDIALFTASLRPGARARQVTTGTTDGLAPDPPSDSMDISLLSGDGHTITYLTGTIPPKGPERNEKVWRLDSNGRTSLVGGFGNVRALTVSGDTIAVLQSGAKVTLVPTVGRRSFVRLQTDPSQLAPGDDYYLGLADDHIVLLTRHSLAIFDRETGRHVVSWPLPRSSDRGGLDVDDGFAIYLDNGVIHLVRLADGRNVVVPLLKGRAKLCDYDPRWAQLEPFGLYESFSEAAPGGGCRASQIRLLPWSTLQHLLG